MSRSGYSDDCGGWSLVMWRGAVASAIRGNRGQAMLKELLQALDDMPVKRLIAHELVTEDGEFCTLGVLGAKRGLAMNNLEAEDPDAVAAAFGIAPALVKEITFENDEQIYYGSTPEQRWAHMREWVASLIKPETAIRSNPTAVFVE